MIQTPPNCAFCLSLMGMNQCCKRFRDEHVNVVSRGVAKVPVHLKILNPGLKQSKVLQHNSRNNKAADLCMIFAGSFFSTSALSEEMSSILAQPKCQVCFAQKTYASCKGKAELKVIPHAASCLKCNRRRFRQSPDTCPHCFTCFIPEVSCNQCCLV